MWAEDDIPVEVVLLGAAVSLDVAVAIGLNMRGVAYIDILGAVLLLWLFESCIAWLVYMLRRGR